MVGAGLGMRLESGLEIRLRLGIQLSVGVGDKAGEMGLGLGKWIGDLVAAFEDNRLARLHPVPRLVGPRPPARWLGALVRAMIAWRSGKAIVAPARRLKQLMRPLPFRPPSPSSSPLPPDLGRTLPEYTFWLGRTLPECTFWRMILKLRPSPGRTRRRKSRLPPL